MVNNILAPISGYQSQSLFSVINPKGEVIASDQPYYSAFQHIKTNPQNRIKFKKMTGTKKPA